MVKTDEPKKKRKRKRGASPVADPQDVSENADSDESENADSDESEDEEEILEAELLTDEEAFDSGALAVELSDSGALKKKKARRDRDSAAQQGSLVKRDPLNAYMQETKRFPLLSREEEHDLAVAYVETGDSAAARKLVESNLRLVVKIAYEYRRAHHNLLDLIQEGNIGLMQAVKKYDPFRGVKLSSYAAWWIRAYILKFILNNWRLVKIGTTQAQRKLFFNLRKERDRLEQLGFQPDAKLLAEHLDVSEKDVIEMEKRLAAPEASLDAPIRNNDGEGSMTRLDMLTTESGRPDRDVADSQFQDLLKKKLEAFAETLEGREETIFRERWLTDSPLTLQKIGDRYGISRERARQLEKRLLGRVRIYLEAELGSAVEIGELLRD